ncbi:hypothetical protein Dimus_039265 [Dionaea muscipula]
MASPSTTPLPNVKSITQEISSKLSTGNYLVWKMQVTPVLRCHGLLGLVDGTTTKSAADAAAADLAAWLRLDQMVLAWIASSLSEDVLLQIIHCTSARDIWITLDTLYGMVSRSRVQSVKRELHALAKGALSAAAYIHQARALSRTLTLVGDPVSDTDLFFLILAGLPSEYDSVVTAIQLANPLPSLDTVTATIVDFEQRLRRHTTATMSSIALIATVHSQESNAPSRGLSTASNRGNYRVPRGRGSGPCGRGSGRIKPRATPIIGDSSSVYCYKCGYPNHKANVSIIRYATNTSLHCPTNF